MYTEIASWIESLSRFERTVLSVATGSLPLLCCAAWFSLEYFTFYCSTACTFKGLPLLRVVCLVIVLFAIVLSVGLGVVHYFTLVHAVSAGQLARPFKMETILIGPLITSFGAAVFARVLWAMRKD